MRVEWANSGKIEVAKFDEAFRGAAEILAQEIRNRAPRITGTLRNSVRVYKSRFPRVSYIVAVGGRGAWGDAFYASWVELGTKRTQGKAFIRRGTRAARKRVLSHIQSGLKLAA